MLDPKTLLAEVTAGSPPARRGRRIELHRAYEGIRPDIAVEQLTEERLKEKEDKLDPRIGPVLPLKRGAGQMEAVWARLWEEDLRRLLETHPQHFQALHALVEGRGGEVSKEHRRDLKKWDYVLRNGSPHPDVQAIMAAAFRQTLDGPTIVDPVDVKAQEDANRVQRFDEHRELGCRRRAERLLQRLLEQDKDEGEGRSR